MATTPPMRFLRCTMVLAAMLAPSATRGDTGPASTAAGAYAHVGAFCLGDVVQITVAGVDDGTAPDIVGFDILRRELDSCSSTTSRITDTPIPRVRESQFTLRFDDGEALSGVLYEYRVVGVDAERTMQTPLAAIYPSSTTNDNFYAGCGEILLGPGNLVDEGGGLFRFESCPGSCLPDLHVDLSPLPELAEYVDTPTTLRLTGRFYLAFGVPLLAPETMQLLACGTSLTATTWTQVKQLFH